MLDTKGPEIRTGRIKDDGLINLVQGDDIDLIAETDAVAAYGPEGAFVIPGRITVSYQSLADDVKSGARVLIADALLALAVQGIDGRIMHCKVESGG